MQRCRVTWTGFGGAPGLSTFYFSDAGAVPTAALRQFFLDMQALFAPGVTIAVANTGDVLAEDTGAISGSWSAPAVTPVTSTGAGTYAAPCGANVRWITGGIVAGRRVRGRTFLVPLSGSSYQSDGTLATTAVTTMTNAASALLTAIVAPQAMLIWSRPFDGSPGNPARLGSAHEVTGSTVPDKAMVLTSRRD